MPQLHCAPSQAWHQDWKSVSSYDMACHEQLPSDGNLARSPSSGVLQV